MNTANLNLPGKDYFVQELTNNLTTRNNLNTQISEDIEIPLRNRQVMFDGA